MTSLSTRSRFLSSFSIVCRSQQENGALEYWSIGPFRFWILNWQSARQSLSDAPGSCSFAYSNTPLLQYSVNAYLPNNNIVIGGHDIPSADNSHEVFWILFVHHRENGEISLDYSSQG